MTTQSIPTVPFVTFLRHAARIVKNPLPFHHENFEKYGDTFRLKIGLRKSVIFSRDPMFVQYALQKNQRNYEKSSIQTKDLAKYVGKGLLTAQGTHWQTQRKLIQPAFHKKQLHLLLGSMYGAIQNETKRLTINTPQDVFPIFNDLAFQTVVQSLFSGEVEINAINRLQHITEAAQKMLVRELRQPYLHWWFKAGGAIQKHLDLVDEAREILRSLVNKRKESGVRKDDLLDMLLDARYEDGEAMEEKQLIDEILILFSAGHETTSNALTFTFELLARNNEVQDKVAAEVLKASNLEKTSLDYLKALPYTKQIVEESMRLYPPAYFIDRVNKEKDEFGGYELPAGSDLLFSLHEIHRHHDYWQDPDSFKPERFSKGNAINHEAYYPFGAGPRMCIGNNFAMYEMILTVAHVMEGLRIEEKRAPIKIKPLITLKPKDAILTFIPR